MLTLEKKSQLEALHTGNIKEGLNLEYKASAAVDKTKDATKLEMARDVSAFANADGGQIIYGMTENKDHEPAGLDNGLDGTVYPPIWFEQVLQQHIKPPILGLKIRHVPLIKPMVAVVIDIPATKADPHQVDGRYYRRHNFNRLMMEHYEVRDAMRRIVDPDLVLEFDLIVGQAAYKDLEFSRFSDISDPTPIGAIIRNLSNQPATYTFISVFVDRRLKITDCGPYLPHPEREFGTNDVRNQLMKKLGPPNDFPIFKEMGYMIDPFFISVPTRLLGHRFGIGYELRAPGCFKARHGHLEFGQSGQMTLRMEKAE